MSRQRSSATAQIKERIKLIDVVRRYVELRRAGNRWVAPCPFHQETKPSFSVNEEEGFFYCFGCQAAGDLFDFYGRINGLDFRETLVQLAEETGVVLQDDRPSKKADAGRDLKKLAAAMYETANKFYRSNLTLPVGKECREYLERRQLSQEIIEQFELGWSLPEWRGLRDRLQKEGFTPAQGAEVGLLAAGDKGSFYDRFRGRLMFPIKNLTGKVIAFGGRIIGNEDAAKYINSTDTPLYKKGDNLYGLFQARRGITAKKTAVLTEGYMDVLTLHQFGYTNACGVLGTAITDEQVRRMAGFSSSLELIFDGDAPGRKAAMKACELVAPKGLRCRVVLLPDGEDIDSLLHKHGPEAFEELRHFAPDGLDFCIRTLASTAAPREALEWVRDFVGKVEMPELLTDFVSRLTRGLDLDEREVRQIVAAKKGHAGAKSSVQQAGSEAANQRPAPAQDSQGPRGPQKQAGAWKPDNKTWRKNYGLKPGPQTLAQRAEAYTSSLKAPESMLPKVSGADQVLLNFAVRHPHLLPKLKEAGAELIITSAWAWGFWEKISSCGPDFAPDAIVRLLDAKEKEFWGRYRVMLAPPPDKVELELSEVCADIARRCADKQARACLQALRRSGSAKDFDTDLFKAVDQTATKKNTSGSADE